VIPKSAMALIAAIATYKAGCVLVPLDPAGDARGLADVIAACSPRYLLAGGSVVDVLDKVLDDYPDGTAPPVGWLGAGAPAARRFAARFVFADARSYSSAPVVNRHSDRDAAQILFTPSATRKPRGVITCHGSVIAFIEWAVRYFGISTSDRVSGHSPLHAGLSTFDAFGAFAAGAELHLVPSELNLLPHALAQFIRTSELTQWLSVPAVLDRLARFNVVAPGDFPALKRLLWCGDVLPTPTLISLMKQLPHVMFTRLYGQAEATIASGYHTLRECPRDAAADIPIGTGCDGQQLIVLDDRFEPTPIGGVGRLYIRGVGLSPGYWNDPERSAHAFVDHPRDGARLYQTGDLARVGHDGLIYFVEGGAKRRRRTDGLDPTPRQGHLSATPRPAPDSRYAARLVRRH
jgi:non-ribosomal peptide synthetase component F